MQLLVPNPLRPIASLLALAVVMSAGCDNKAPTSPSPPPAAGPSVPFTPTPPPGAPVWNWNLTTVLRDVTGPDSCFKERQFRTGIPRSITWQMEVTRTGDEVTFDYDVRNWPSDNVRHAGRVEGDEFSARSVPWAVSFPSCPDGAMLSGSFDASVTGRFEADGTRLVANELWNYHFSSGTTTLFLDWSGERR